MPGRVISIGVALLVLLQGTAQAGGDPAAICKAAKAAAAGGKSAALLRAFGKNTRKPAPLRLALDVSKAQSRFTRAFSRAELQGGCPTIDDMGPIEAKVDALVADLVGDIAPPPLPGCGNGVLEAGEECDGTAAGGDAACPGRCLPEAMVGGDIECVCNADPTPVATGGYHRGPIRPVEGGNSLFSTTSASCLLTAGFVSAGTLGAVVYATGGAGDAYVLSNSHVIGRQSDHDATTPDDARCVGTPETTALDPIMQPGTLDGGIIGSDEIGELPAFALGSAVPSLDPYEPICFPSGYCPGASGFPLPLCNGTGCVDGPTENCIDAAIARITLPAAVPSPGAASILDVGPNASFGAPIGPPSCKDDDLDLTLIGRIVKKSGRTTGFTFGRIVGVVDVIVNYGEGVCSLSSGNAGEDCLVDADCPTPAVGACVLVDAGYSTSTGSPLFINQLMIEAVGGAAHFSQPGDSGSLVLSGANEPVGLLFAGGEATTFANPIRPVLDRFGIGF